MSKHCHALAVVSAYRSSFHIHNFRHMETRHLSKQYIAFFLLSPCYDYSGMQRSIRPALYSKASGDAVAPEAGFQSFGLLVKDISSVQAAAVFTGGQRVFSNLTFGQAQRRCYTWLSRKVLLFVLLPHCCC